MVVMWLTSLLSSSAITVFLVASSVSCCLLTSWNFCWKLFRVFTCSKLADLSDSIWTFNASISSSCNFNFNSLSLFCCFPAAPSPPWINPIISPFNLSFSLVKSPIVASLFLIMCLYLFFFAFNASYDSTLAGPLSDERNPTGEAGSGEGVM
ncbi:hypothetical protein WICPIJ_006037 [Wickerhamomyces pijperi]|uniref:Uncharacterized protein n=1 Tax=Wickerhamomyces pijperi TaxID=599730 RepID=A0A9P8Q2Z4_WICPI|nr:hypothetical protein WICPIJ_006037 [Wickerhamomyces pijperi]